MPLASNIAGDSLDVRIFRRAGETAYAWVEVDGLDAAQSSHEPSMLQELRRRQSAALSRWRTEGLCTDVELRTIEALWLEGIGLRALARREGVAPAAIGCRLKGLTYKAPEFVRWWRLKNRLRCAR